MRVCAHAAAQGVQPDQIIFTDVAMKHEHIRRSGLADLFLDTPLCNAHTTSTDILSAGLLMVTLPLEKMATRVVGSLCLATGVGEEMIVKRYRSCVTLKAVDSTLFLLPYSMKEYEERAVSLALNRPKLQALKNKLKAVRMTFPFFDTKRWVRIWRGLISRCGISIARGSIRITSKLPRTIQSSLTTDKKAVDTPDCR